MTTQTVCPQALLAHLNHLGWQAAGYQPCRASMVGQGLPLIENGFGGVLLQYKRLGEIASGLIHDPHPATHTRPALSPLHVPGSGCPPPGQFQWQTHLGTVQ